MRCAGSFQYSLKILPYQLVNKLIAVDSKRGRTNKLVLIVIFFVVAIGCQSEGTTGRRVTNAGKGKGRAKTREHW